MTRENKMKVLFMGTPEFAVATLEALLGNGWNIVGVVTVPDKPAGRGRKIAKSAVKMAAENHSLPILQPKSLKDPEFIEALENLDADLFVVVAFRMLPKAVWKIPRYGTINLHASLLPNYRGAAPINHALINGEKVTGVTTFLIDDEIDTGKILLQDEIPISSDDDAGMLHDKLMVRGAALVIKTIEGISDNSIVPKDQSVLLKYGEKPKMAPKIFPDDCIIHWNEAADTVYNFIRGLAPYPGARQFLTKNDERLMFKVCKCHPILERHNMNPGTLVSDGKSFLQIACNDGFISIDNIKIEGRKALNIKELLCGFDISGWLSASI